MSSPQEWADYLDPAAPDPELTVAERESLRRIRLTLADDATWSEPPAGQRSSILEHAALEQRTLDQRTVEQDPGEQRSLAELPHRGRRRPQARWLAVAGVAAAVALIAVLLWPRPATTTTTFAMAGTSFAPSARATAELEPRSAGVAITLQIKGLAAAPAGSYYAAWLRGPAGTVPVGSFHWHKGGIPIDLWSGVTSDRYPELFVTLQHEGRSPEPSTEIVLSGHAGGS